MSQNFALKNITGHVLFGINQYKDHTFEEEENSGWTRERTGDTSRTKQEWDDPYSKIVVIGVHMICLERDVKCKEA